MIVLSLAFLIVAMGASFQFRSERRSLVFTGVQKIFKYIFWIAVILVFIFLSYQVRQLFLLWQSSAPTSYLIPPYQNISYFLTYAFYIFLFKPLSHFLFREFHKLLVFAQMDQSSLDSILASKILE